MLRMNARLLNRDGFQMPVDGWFQLAPLGEFPHAAVGVVQVVDSDACLAMAARFAADAAAENFAGVLVDFDHFSLDGEKRSEAAGWITALEARGEVGGVGCEVGGAEPTPHPSKEGSQSGLWATIRWSDIGEAAVKGGRYRFLSPVWTRVDCVDLGVDPATGWPRVRPVRLLNAAVTNDPNLKGMRALSNSARDLGLETADRRPGKTDDRWQRTDDRTGNRGDGGSVDFSALGSAASGKGEGSMKAVIERLVNHLGLGADSTEAVILEKMAGLPALTVVTELQNSLRDLQAKHDALVTNQKAVEGELVNRHLADFEGVVTEKSREFWTAQLMSNRAGALTALAELAMLRDAGGPGETGGKSGDPSTGSGQARKPLHNRATARPVPPGQGAQGADGESKAVKIRNRAHEIVAAEKIPFSSAFRRAEREVLEV